MEWVEAAGKTVEEATEQALDQLGVAEPDAEIVVLELPKTGLFGRVRGEARVRVRVRPVGPRPRRPSRSRGATRSSKGSRGEPGATGNGSAMTAARGTGRSRGTGRAGKPKGASGNSRARSANGVPGANSGVKPEKEERTVASEMTLQEQGDAAREFIAGLLEVLGMEATLGAKTLDEQTIEISANGEGLGTLVGPRGSTLSALQDLTRTAVQSRFSSRTDRIMVDVARYRERRAEALRRFTQEQAALVLETGVEKPLEPMSAADRKVIHDAVNEIDGVVTRSEGEDAYRFVVISPE